METSSANITIGFNRRFAPLAIQAKSLLGAVGGPFNIVITINAGSIPHEHWIQDAAIGGGRLLGGACHFIDLCAFFTGSKIVAVCANAIAGNDGIPAENASMLLRFADGSNAVVNYFTNGSNTYEKERIELYRAGHIILIENWRVLRSYGFKKDIGLRSAQDKGHVALIASWVKNIRNGGPPLMDQEGLVNSTLATIAAVESLSQACWISL